MEGLVELASKTVLVTGASSGIGRATAQCCARLGARVVVTGRDLARLEETRASLEGEDHWALPQDLTEPLEPFFQTILQKAGKLDGMVHCAGLPGVIPLKVLGRTKLEQIMAVNFYSFVELVRQFGKRRYSRDGASVVALSTVLIQKPRPYELAYISSKAALEAAVPVMAMELAKRSIRVNCVSPGAVRTEMIERLAEELDNRDFLESLSQSSILGWQTPEEIAGVCAFLLSDSASAITARCVRADGGFI